LFELRLRWLRFVRVSRRIHLILRTGPGSMTGRAARQLPLSRAASYRRIFSDATEVEIIHGDAMASQGKGHPLFLHIAYREFAVRRGSIAGTSQVS
jgi:hypothetical protein